MEEWDASDACDGLLVNTYITINDSILDDLIICMIFATELNISPPPWGDSRVEFHKYLYCIRLGHSYTF